MGAKGLSWLEEMNRPVVALASIQSTVRGLADRKRMAMLERRVAELERKLGCWRRNGMPAQARRVIETVSDICGTPANDVLSRKRTWQVTWPRQIACWILVKKIHMANMEVSRQFGLTVSAVQHNVRAASNAIETRPEAAAEVQHILQTLEIV
jgi:chromosomal replication initiation ATPase DnaA